MRDATVFEDYALMMMMIGRVKYDVNEGATKRTISSKSTVHICFVVSSSEMGKSANTNPNSSRIRNPTTIE